VNGQVDFTPSMWIFTTIGIAAVVVSILLLLLDKKRHYGLQEANVKKEDS
jgi:dipeptide/tripeptide permease